MHLYRLPAALLLLAFFLTSPLAHAEERGLMWYRENGVTVVAQEMARPLSFRGLDGAPKGYLVDVWKAWSKKTGIPVTFRLVEWPETLRLIQSGECDIHSGLFYTEERDEFLDYSVPYATMKAALMVLKDQDTDVDEIFETYTIGVLEKGYSEHYMRTNHPKSDIRGYPSSLKIAKALVSGEIDAVAGDHPIVGYEAGKLGVSQDLLIKKILYEKELRGAVFDGNTVMLDIVNKGLSSFSEKDKETISERWFVDEVSSTDWMWHIAVVVGILVFALLALILLDRRRSGLPL